MIELFILSRSMIGFCYSPYIPTVTALLLSQLTIKFNIMFHTEIGSSLLPGGWGRGGEGRTGIIHLFYFHPVDLLNADMESHKTDFIFRLVLCKQKQNNYTLEVHLFYWRREHVYSNSGRSVQSVFSISL